MQAHGVGEGGPCDAGVWATVGSNYRSTLQNRLLALGDELLDGVASIELGGPVGSAREVRFSRRLAAMEATPIVDKAIAIRAMREEGGCNGGRRRTSLNRKKVQSMSTNCGVLLNEGETNSFKEFMSHRV